MQEIICSYCGNDLEGEEAENPYIVEDEAVCNDCYSEHHQDTCTLCEEYFDKPTCAEEGFYYFSQGNEIGIRPGIYQTIERPFYSCDIFGDNLHVYKDRLKLIRPLYDDSEEESGIICPECANGQGIFREHQYADGSKRKDRDYDEKGRLIRHDYFPMFALKKGDTFSTFTGTIGQCISSRFFKCLPYKRGEKTCLIIKFNNGATQRFVYDSCDEKSDYRERYSPVKLLARAY